MSALKSLSLAIALAARRRDQAAAVVAQAQRACQHAGQQQHQLASYALETDARWLASAQVASSPEFMRHHSQFMNRLTEAIELQKGSIHSTNEQLAAARKALLDAEFRLMGLQQVLKKRQVVLVTTQAKREQKQFDELAAQQFARARREQQHKESL